MAKSEPLPTPPDEVFQLMGHLNTVAIEMSCGPSADRAEHLVKEHARLTDEIHASCARHGIPTLAGNRVPKEFRLRDGRVLTPKL